MDIVFNLKAFNRMINFKVTDGSYHFFNSMLDVIEIAIIMLYVANCDENLLPVNYPLNAFRKKNKTSDLI